MDRRPAEARRCPAEAGGAAPGFEVEELTPDGGPVGRPAEPPAPEPSRRRPPARPGSRRRHPAPRPAQGERRRPKPAPAPGRAARAPRVRAAVDDDDEPPPTGLVRAEGPGSREDTIRDALERRVKIQGLQRFFGRIVVPTEKITEIRNNKKRIVERKTYPGYIMVEMELNEKTWFVVRETPGVGDFVGAHGTPTKMTEAEVNQMLGQETAKAEEAPRVRIDVERGDRVKIKDGPFENFEGTVEEVIEARGLVKVMLIIFNRPTPVDLEYWQVERI